jgi:aldehyde:ferredoxin oxidoreductase
MFGYHGKVLHIDLSTRQTVWEPIEEQVLRRFIGGIGLGTYLLYTYHTMRRDAQKVGHASVPILF